MKLVYSDGTILVVPDEEDARTLFDLTRELGGEPDPPMEDENK